MNFKEKLNILKRSLILINQASKGYILTNSLKDIPLIIKDFVGIYFISLIIDGILYGKELKELLITTFIMFGITLGLDILSNIISFKSERKEFEFNPEIANEYIITVKLLNADGTSAVQTISKPLVVQPKALESNNIWMYCGIAAAALVIICIASIIISNKVREKIW